MEKARPSSTSASPTSGNISSRLDGALQKQTSVFHWKNICYDIRVKKEERRILNNVDGWVKPGTLTALFVSHSSSGNN